MDQKTLQSVVSRLGAKYENLSEDEKQRTSQQAAIYLTKGWDESDVVRYLLCTEEISPELPEETALNRMRKIRAKYIDIREK